MKNSKWIVAIITFAAIFIASQNVYADGTNAVASTVKRDLMTTCPVSGDKLNSDMGKPYVFVYQGQQVKLCCPMCKAEFDKNPQKFLKKIQAAAKK